MRLSSNSRKDIKYPRMIGDACLVFLRKLLILHLLLLCMTKAKLGIEIIATDEHEHEKQTFFFEMAAKL